MPMGLNISPSIWQSYINAILECLKNRKYWVATTDDKTEYIGLATMDDLLLFTPSKKSHIVN